MSRARRPSPARARLLPCLLLVALASGARAQSPAGGGEDAAMHRAIAAAEARPEHGDASAPAASAPAPQTAMPDSPTALVVSDSPTRQTYLEAMKRFYEYRASGFAYRQRVFEWQLLSSKVIFGIVLLLVVAGVYFAAVQFHISMKTVGDVAGSGSSEIEISATKVAFKSSVLGVVVLGISLAFCYFYLVYVYPIQSVI